MMKEFKVSPAASSAVPVTFSDSCTGCNICAQVCQCDVLLPDTRKGKHPIVMWPGECWYCGACVMSCPVQAIRLEHPLMNRARFIKAFR